MDAMLSKALREFTAGPLNQLMVNLGGEKGDEWEQEFKRFLRKEPCWANGQSASAPVPAAEKFVLLADFGTIVVPDSYAHATRLASFSKGHRKRFAYYNEAITDEHFSNPSRVLKPGDKLSVRVFKQAVSGTTTSEERMAFLAAQNAVHTGAQGASLVWEEKRDALPKGFSYVSFDEKDRLWQDAGGHHRVPRVVADPGGAFRFRLGSFEYGWDVDDALLCFCDLPE